MKLTKAKKLWVWERVALYCGYLKCQIPQIFFTMAEYNRWKAQIREERGYSRVGRSNPYLLGVCHRSDGFLVILVKKSPSLERLDQTIRHELLHWAKPSYNHHSAEFADRMERLKRGQLDANGRFK